MVRAGVPLQDDLLDADGVEPEQAAVVGVGPGHDDAGSSGPADRVPDLLLGQPRLPGERRVVLVDPQEAPTNKPPR